MFWLQCCWWSFTAKVVCIYLDWIGNNRAAFGWTWLDIGPFNSIRQIWLAAATSSGWSQTILIVWMSEMISSAIFGMGWMISLVVLVSGCISSYKNCWNISILLERRVSEFLKTNTMEVEPADRFQNSELFDPFKSKLRGWDKHFPAHFTAFWISSTQSSDDFSCDSRKNVILL